VEIHKVGVLGCGTMGSGICQVVSRAGIPVAFVEVDPDAVEGGMQRIAGALDRLVDRGKLDAAERDGIMERITGDTSYDVLADADIVIEAIPEQLEVKRQSFEALDGVLKPDAIIATNTSSLSVIDIAVATQRSDRVLGFHFFNPAPVMPLIELITTVVTDPEVVEVATTFAERIGKRPVVAKDRAGFVANLLLFPYLNQAVGMLEQGYASREDIDAAMKLGAGHPMGPLALMDLIGLDSANSILERMYEQFRDVRYAPRPLIRQLLVANYRGRKTGRGFYTYEAPNSPKITEGEARRRPIDADQVAGWTTVGVLGTGVMASGIAEVCARAGYDVLIRGRSPDRAQAAIERVAKSMERAVERGKLDPAARDEALGHLGPTADMGDLAGADVVVEAVAEDLNVKAALFAELDERIKPEALLATTTSSLPVVSCAVATSRPERVVGLHFFNPAAVMRLVEVVHTVRTEADAVEQALAFADALGKHPVLCGDRAGFIVNALLFPYLNDAVNMLEEGYASVEDIDTAMKLGCGHPMGPFELMDIVGLDVTLEIIRALHAEFRESGFAPAPLLGHMVSAGYLGRKAGRGFHVYGQ
jgi:3-hydroxybutyryl-CoA dehydrogenase